MRFAPVAPAYCAACFQHDAQVRHVDFEGTYDGPVLTLEDGRKQPIDDLILCEKCLVAAFELLDPQQMNRRLERAKKTNDELQRQLSTLNQENAKLRDVIGVKRHEKVKKPPTARQLAALEKAHEARRKKAVERRQQREIAEAEERKAKVKA